MVLDVQNQIRQADALAASAPAAIDWERGVMLWGQESRLIAAVERLLDTASEKYPVLAADAGEIDWEEAGFNLHSLRGVAGNLALPVVTELAGNLETLVKTERSSEALPLLPELRGSLEAVRDELSRRHRATAIVPAPLPEDLLLSMHRLRELLAHNELDDAILESVCNGLESSLQRTHAQALRSTTDAFEFQQAHALVQQLISEHSTSVEQ